MDQLETREGIEERLDALRQEAMVRAARRPRPAPATTPGASAYADLPVLKPPVWKWQVPIYFFVGGAAGMSAMLAAGALAAGEPALARVAMWIAAAGAVISPALLIWDLGRPLRFLNMLRVFKPQSPMSVGTWALTTFGAFAVPGAVALEAAFRASAAGHPLPILAAAGIVGAVGAAGAGVLVATYTGALIAATVIPAWSLHPRLLPFHFGMSGLGSAAGLLALLGPWDPALGALLWAASIAQTAVLVWLELDRHGRADAALHEGRSGWTLRVGEVLEGPGTAALLLAGRIAPAAIAFLVGALVTRFGWLAAGRASARDPRALFDAQRSEDREIAALAPPPLATGDTAAS